MKILEKIFPCLFRKEAAIPETIDCLPWNSQEISLFNKINKLSQKKASDELKWYAERRLAYQLSINEVSHDWFGLVYEELVEDGEWNTVVELLGYKWRDMLHGFLSSEKHREALMDDSLEYIGIAYRENKCVIILGN